MVARRYLIGGLVQGVGFRLFTEDVARREGLEGFVRNLDDGRVEVLAAGEREAIARFETALNQGPPASRVDVIKIEPAKSSAPQSGFCVRL